MAAICLPSGATMTTSNLAVSLSLSDLPAKSGLTPIIGACGVDGKRELALDGAAAWLGEPHHDVGFERLGRCGKLAESNLEGSLPVGVGLGQIGERNALGAGLSLVIAGLGRIEAERIAGIARPLRGLGDRDLAFDAKP